MLLLYRGENFDPNFYYYSGFDIDNCFLFPQSKTLFVPKLNEQLAKKHFLGKVNVYSNFKDIEKFVYGETIEVDFSSITARLAYRLKKICKINDCSNFLSQKRGIKNSNEVSKIKKAANLTKKLIESLDFSQKTELDIEKQIKIKTIELGLEAAFSPIVATNKSTSFPHYKAGKRKLSSHVLIDYGLKFGHYCSDISRCHIFDKTKTSLYEKLKGICYEIIDELPNMEIGADVSDFSSVLLKKSGFPPLIHSIGHGVGLEVHEFPSLGPKSKDKIKGTVMAIEPAFYNKFGMRYEETVYFDGKKAKVL